MLILKNARAGPYAKNFELIVGDEKDIRPLLDVLPRLTTQAAPDEVLTLSEWFQRKIDPELPLTFCTSRPAFVDEDRWKELSWKELMDWIRQQMETLDFEHEIIESTTKGTLKQLLEEARHILALFHNEETGGKFNLELKDGYFSETDLKSCKAGEGVKLLFSCQAVPSGLWKALRTWSISGEHAWKLPIKTLEPIEFPGDAGSMLLAALLAFRASVSSCMAKTNEDFWQLFNRYYQKLEAFRRVAGTKQTLEGNVLTGCALPGLMVKSGKSCYVVHFACDAGKKLRELCLEKLGVGMQSIPDLTYAEVENKILKPLLGSTSVEGILVLDVPWEIRSALWDLLSTKDVLWVSAASTCENILNAWETVQAEKQWSFLIHQPNENSDTPTLGVIRLGRPRRSEENTIKKLVRLLSSEGYAVAIRPSLVRRTRSGKTDGISLRR